jgi:hypothetical protein
MVVLGPDPRRARSQENFFRRKARRKCLAPRYPHHRCQPVDGNTAIVGGPGDYNAAGDVIVGSAWVFTRSGGVWSQQGPKLVGTGAVGGASGEIEQGWRVSLSRDGNTAIVGGNLDNNSVGAAWVYTRSGGVWSQQGPKLVGTAAVGPAEQG